MSDDKHTSIDVGRAALKIAITSNRSEEQLVKEELALQGVRSTAVDFGGEFIQSIVKIVERAVVASQRQGIVTSTHVGAGAVAGAAHEALEQVKVKAIGFNVGGKIGIARYGSHIGVCVFFAIGLLNLNDVAIGMGHRVV